MARLVSFAQTNISKFNLLIDLVYKTKKGSLRSLNYIFDLLF